MADNNSQFIESLKEYAIQEQIKYGIPASITLAQAILETGSGTSNLAKRDNLFGIKLSSDWKGSVSYHNDDAPNEGFKNYNSIQAAFDDHSKTLMLDRYQKYVGKLSSNNYQGWAYGIKAGGYATAEDYAEKLINIIKSDNLDIYDREAIERAQQQGVQIGYMKGQKGTTTTVVQTQKIALNPLEGKWCLPIDFSNLTKTSDYGVNRGSHNHKGIDISTNHQNLPLYATENNGVVTKVANEPGGAGNYVKVEYTRSDNTKMETTYMHMSAINVKEGQTVQAGEQLGVSGNTGHSTGPHLHFETAIQKNGEWQKFDPTYYLAELELRGNMDVALNDKSGKDVLAESKSQMEISQSQTVAIDQNQQLLANITNSNDPDKWLAYLMSQNSEHSTGQDAFTSLISNLFQSALTILVSTKVMDSADQAAQDKVVAEQKGTDNSESTVVKRERGTVDVSAAKTLAEAVYEDEAPSQEKSQGLRQA